LKQKSGEYGSRSGRGSKVGHERSAGSERRGSVTGSARKERERERDRDRDRERDRERDVEREKERDVRDREIVRPKDKWANIPAPLPVS
jgi:Ni/Co efflux regulator RcnB